MSLEFLHDVEPGSDAIKRKDGTRGSWNPFHDSSTLTMGRIPAAEWVPSMSRVNARGGIGFWERFTPWNGPGYGIVSDNEIGVASAGWSVTRSLNGDESSGQTVPGAGSCRSMR
jgi:hypothetical protein